MDMFAEITLQPKYTDSSGHLPPTPLHDLLIRYLSHLQSRHGITQLFRSPGDDIRIVVIGGGPGGYVAAIRAAQLVGGKILVRCQRHGHDFG